jgi:hypothetical protein
MVFHSATVKKHGFEKHIFFSNHENEVTCVPQECKLNHVFFVFKKKKNSFHPMTGRQTFFFQIASLHSPLRLAMQ